MQVLYAGVPGSAQAAAWTRFLSTLGDTAIADVQTLTTTDLTGVGLLVVDAPWRHPQPEGVDLETLSCPTVLVGNYGAHLAELLHLKLGTWFGCKCLGQDAIAWDTSHPVYDGLADSFVETTPPDHWLSDRARLLFPIPEKLTTLRVLREPSDDAGQVTTGLDFLDSPECEVIAGGINDKTSNHFAIGRQGRFLQWGFSGSPEDWTDEGRSLFAACLSHLQEFREDPVRELRTTHPRAILRFSLASPVWRGEGMPPEIQTLMQRSFLQRTFHGTPPAGITESATAALAWFDEHRGFLRNDGQGWYVDQEAYALGVPIDDPAFLDAVLRARNAELWETYTGRVLDADSADWLARNRGHLYFTDWGGYRWVSTLEPPSPRPPAVDQPLPEPTLVVAAARYEGITRCVFELYLPSGFHAYGPDASDGLPLAVEVPEGLELVEELELWPSTDHLTGVVSGRFGVRGCNGELEVGLRVQLCDELTCLAPVTHELRCPVMEGN